MARIVIVEDVPALADMYKFKFEQSGYDVAVANNGEEALRIITELKPDLVLLDLMLPILSGEEVLRQVRGTDWGTKVKFIILTNIGEEEAAIRLANLKVDHYIVKADYTPTQVVDIVKETLA